MTREPESQERWEKVPDDGSWLVAGEGGGSIKARCFIEFDADHIVALHNARLASQDAGGWDVSQNTGSGWIVSRGHGPDRQKFIVEYTEEDADELADYLNSLTTRLRKTEQERDSALQREASSVKGMHKYRQERVAAEARVTALEAALRSWLPSCFCGAPAVRREWQAPGYWADMCETHVEDSHASSSLVDIEIESEKIIAALKGALNE